MIKIIQGDSHKEKITVLKGGELIEKLLFSSKRFNLVIPATKIDDNLYILSFTSELTKTLDACTTTYDITAILRDNQVNTKVHNDKLLILEKGNDIDGYKN